MKLLLILLLILPVSLHGLAQKITLNEVGFKLKEADKELMYSLIEYEVKIYNGLFKTLENDSAEIRVNLYKYKDFRNLLKQNDLKGFTESGFYSSKTNDSHVLYNEKSDIEVVLHEVSHALLRKNFEHPPRWFNEGLAEFLESLETKDGRIQVYTNHAHINLCRQLVSDKEVNLSRFFSTERAYWQDKRQQQYMYAVSYGIVYMLIKKDPKLINQSLKMLKEGKDEKVLFTELFGSFRNFESHFRFFYR